MPSINKPKVNFSFDIGHGLSSDNQNVEKNDNKFKNYFSKKYLDKKLSVDEKISAKILTQPEDKEMNNLQFHGTLPLLTQPDFYLPINKVSDVIVNKPINQVDINDTIVIKKLTKKRESKKKIISRPLFLVPKKLSYTKKLMLTHIAT